MVAKSREKILFFVVEDFTFLFFTHNELSGESSPKKALSARACCSNQNRGVDIATTCFAGLAMT